MNKSFEPNDFVLIHYSRGKSAGSFEMNKIKTISPTGQMEMYMPLQHTYRNDGEEKSQVIKIPQYSTVKIEKNVTFFSKKWNGTTGGIITFFCSEGLILEGKIGLSNEESPMENISNTATKKSKAGIIAILANYGSNDTRKVLDIKTTDSFLTITIPENIKISFPNEGFTLTNHTFQHITIPPNLDLHLSQKEGKEKMWYSKLRGSLTAKGQLNKDYQKLITIVFPPISVSPVFTSRKYGAGLIIGFSQLPHWNENTGFVLELFAQKEEGVTIPPEEHYKGDVGSLLPFKYSVMGKTYKEDYKQGDYFIRPFIITNHDKKNSDELQIYFGD